DLPAGRAIQAADQGQKRSLPTAGRAKDCIELSLLHLDIYTTQYFSSVVIGITYVFYFHDAHTVYLASFLFLYSICDKIAFGFIRMTGIHDISTAMISKPAPAAVTRTKWWGVTMTFSAAFPNSVPRVPAISRLARYASGNAAIATR